MGVRFTTFDDQKRSHDLVAWGLWSNKSTRFPTISRYLKPPVSPGTSYCVRLEEHKTYKLFVG